MRSHARRQSQCTGQGNVSVLEGYFLFSIRRRDWGRGTFIHNSHSLQIEFPRYTALLKLSGNRLSLHFPFKGRTKLAEVYFKVDFRRVVADIPEGQTVNALLRNVYGCRET
jgi:hypothetical protein